MDGKIRLLINCEPAESNINNNVDNNIDGSPTNQKSRLSLPSPKRRRAFDKRVVSFPVADADGSRAKGAGESAPPADSWSWRKYGQKPIKGSPYPRGYYRCSSSKGCPARKQVERSGVDPTTMVVTYSCEHNHPWPLPGNNSSSTSTSRTNKMNPDPIPPGPDNDYSSGGSEDIFSDLIVDEAAPNGFWFSDVGPAASPNADVIFAPVFGAGDELALDGCDARSGCGEDDVLFEGLGELPECSVVFRRSYAERQLAAG